MERGKKTEMGEELVGAIERLPIDILAQIFLLLSSVRDLAQAISVCRKWRRAVEQSLAGKERLSFSGLNMDEDSIARFIHLAYNLKELDMSQDRSSPKFWGCQINDEGLCKISSAKCLGNLTNISLWCMRDITDKGLIQLVSRAISLEHLNIGGTFITDESLLAIADSCPHLKVIILWGCRCVTESGLIMYIKTCHKLERINIGGMRVRADCFIRLLAFNPVLQIEPI